MREHVDALDLESSILTGGPNVSARLSEPCEMKHTDKKGTIVIVFGPEHFVIVSKW